METHRRILTILAVGGIALMLAVPFAAAAPAKPKAPKGVTCSPQSDGVHVSWDAESVDTSYGVYRKVGNNGAWIKIATTTDTTYVDHTAAPGQLYHYAVTGINGEGESDLSGTCNVTSIPFFPNALVAMAALSGSVGAVVLIRRRRG